MQDADAVGDVLGFRLGVASPRKIPNLTPDGARGLQILSQAPLIVGHHARRGVQNFLRRAVILLQAHHARSRIILVKAENVANVGAAPPVNGLVLVAHHAQIP